MKEMESSSLTLEEMKRISVVFDKLRSWWRKSRRPEYRWLWVVAAVAIYFGVLSMPLPDFSPEGKRTIAVFGVAIYLWATNSLPQAIVGIAVLLLLPLSGGLSQEKTYAYFGNKAVFFVLGVFILASPVRRSGLSTRIALWVVSRFGHSQPTLLGSILGISTVLSFGLSAHAVAAMLLPIVIEIVRSTGAKPGSQFGMAALLALGWGTVTGANATLLGGARAALSLGILQSSTGQTISFFQWAIATTPIVLTIAVVGYLLLLLIGQDKTVSLSDARTFLAERSKQMGPVSRREQLTAWIVLFTFLLWITRGEASGLDTIAFIGVLLAFTFRVAKWREVEEDVNWGIFIMYGSAIALSSALRETGAASSLAHTLWPERIQSPALVFAIIVCTTIFLTEFMSNAAAVAVILPVGLVLAAQHGVEPRALALGVSFGAGMAYMFPVSNPEIAMVVSSGYVRPSQAFRRGVVLNFLAYLIFLAMSKLYWPLLGLRW